MWFFFLYFIVMFLYVLKNIFSADELLVIITRFYIFFYMQVPWKRENFENWFNINLLSKRCALRQWTCPFFHELTCFGFILIINLYLIYRSPQKCVLSELNNSINCLQVFLTATDVGQEDNLFKKWNYYRQ